MIVCYSKELKRRIAVDVHINADEGENNYLIAIGESPLFTFILIRADTLKETYDKYWEWIKAAMLNTFGKRCDSNSKTYQNFKRKYNI